MLKGFQRADVIIDDVLDERGRFISTEEANDLLTNAFRDPYDPRRLCLWLLLSAGLRPSDGVNIHLSDFKNDFTELQMSQHKANPKKKKGHIYIKRQPRYVPLPPKLSQHIRHFCKYRVMVGQYVGENIEEFRLWPKMHIGTLHNFFHKLRKKHADRFPYIMDKWKVQRGYTKNGTLLYEKPFYRIAPHMARGYYVTECHKETGGDINQTIKLSGHQQMENCLRYTKVMDLHSIKRNVMKNDISSLGSSLVAPLLSGQKTLVSY